MEAKVMFAKYGNAAATIAQLRARQHDQDAVKAWAAVARAALRRPRSKSKGDASLGEVLGGQVTKQVMAADGVERDDVERLMAKTNERAGTRVDEDSRVGAAGVRGRPAEAEGAGRL
jgi:hypothetical protein